MIRSMTGFGAGSAETPDYRVQAEVKAVNHRYLDIDIRAPRSLDRLNELMKSIVRERVSRGKVTLNIQFLDKRERAHRAIVDKNLAISYQEALNEIRDVLHLPHSADVELVAACPGVISFVEEKDPMPGLDEVLTEAIVAAMKDFDLMRLSEGAHIEADFLKRLAVIEERVGKVAALAPKIVEHYRERIDKTLKELLCETSIDEARVIQEVALYADHVNYTEEIVRLRSHIAQFSRMIECGASPVGRQLDFLIQEMNREANTTASKASNADAAHLTVEIKSEIEKLREQVQNIE